MSDDVEGANVHGLKRLRFESDLEQKFLNSLLATRSTGTPKTSLLVTVLTNSLLLADWLMIRDVMYQAIAMRLLLVTPVGLILALVSFKSFNMRTRERILLFVDVLLGLVQAWLCVKSQSEYAQHYLTVLTLIVLYATSHLRARFWSSVKTVGCILTIFLASLLFIENPIWPLLAAIFILLVSTSVFSLFHLYRLEYDARMNFLMTMRHKRMSQELTLTNARLEKVSKVDSLTQVANRLHFEQYLNSTWERAKKGNNSVVLMMLDVDYFKRYNDHFGHLQGDQCLITVAQAIFNSLRRPGDLVARYGGEEFVVVFNSAKYSDAKNAAERVSQAVRQLNIPHPTSDVAPYVTVSVGLASMQTNEPNASPMHLISLADNALYQAKNEGRNRVFFYEPGLNA